MMIDGIDIDASSSIHVTFKPMNSFNQGLSSTSVTSNRPRTNSGMASPREVNGSSHTVLAPYWWGKRKAQMLVARMESSRGGKLLLRCSDNKVHIGGNAVVVTSGNFFLPKLPSNGSIKPHPASSYHTPHPRVSRILGHLSPCKASSETPAKCRVGIVGYGKIGQFLVKNMDKRLMKLSFVCDPGNPGQI